VLHDQTLFSFVSGDDIDGDAVTFSVAGGPSSGDLTFNSDGSYTYAPDPAFVGSDSFDFQVSDGLASDTGTVTINVYNTAPTAYDSSESVLHDQSLSSFVSGDDIDGDTVTFTVTAGPGNGTLCFGGDGSYIYTPDPGYVGSDSFDFEVSDGLASDTGTVTIDVYNTAPEAHDGWESVLHDQELSSFASGDDIDGDALTFAVDSGPANGVLNFNSDGSYTYTPNFRYVGLDSFTFTVSDGIETSDPATITIDVYNTEPVAEDDLYMVPQAAPGTTHFLGSVLDNDFDMDGDTLTANLLSSPSDAESFTLNPDGTFEFEPIAEWDGEDQFEYEVTDGIDTDTAFVVLKLEACEGAVLDENGDPKKPDITFDETKFQIISTKWTEAPTPLEDGARDGFHIKLNGIGVTGACAVYRSVSISAVALEDDFISRSDSESYYFDKPHVTGPWIIHRGTDYNLTEKQWREQIKGITQAQYDALTPAEKTALTNEYKIWGDKHVTGHQMTGSFNVTYEYAAQGNIKGHPWVGGRNSVFGLERGDLTPPGHAYPYGRSLNADVAKWVQDQNHSTKKPANWGAVSTLTVSVQFYINKAADQITVTGSAVINDINGQTTINLPEVEEPP
jgi:hypothetical protein